MTNGENGHGGFRFLSRGVIDTVVAASILSVVAFIVGLKDDFVQSKNTCFGKIDQHVLSFENYKLLESQVHTNFENDITDIRSEFNFLQGNFNEYNKDYQKHILEFERMRWSIGQKSTKPITDSVTMPFVVDFSAPLKTPCTTEVSKSDDCDENQPIEVLFYGEEGQKKQDSGNTNKLKSLAIPNSTQRIDPTLQP